jgi:hypothetical protein
LDTLDESIIKEANYNQKEEESAGEEKLIKRVEKSGEEFKEDENVLLK